MIYGVRIWVEGSPEKVQWVADALEVAFPDILAWSDQHIIVDSSTIQVIAVADDQVNGCEAA